MKKILLIILAVLVVIVALMFVLLPSELKVQEKATIDAPKWVVFAQVNDLKLRETWDPWWAEDPSIETTYGAITKGEGAIRTWTSANGNGKQVYTEVKGGELINSTLEFEGVEGIFGARFHFGGIISS